MKTFSRVPVTCIALASTVVLAGCGGDTTKTVSETKTVTVAAQTAPPTQTTTQTLPAGAETTTAPATASEPLPGGRAALDGTYFMRARDSSFVGENIVAGDESDENWFMTPDCSGDPCRVKLRREVKSGGFENVVLEEIGEGRYAGTSTGKTECGPAFDERFVPSRTRYSVRVTAVAELGGRPTAQRLDGYRTVTARCQGSAVKGIVSMRGSRTP